MKLTRSEIAKRFSTYQPTNEIEIKDSQDKEISIGCIVFNSKTETEHVVDEKMIKTLKFGVEVLGFSNMEKLTVINKEEEVHEQSSEFRSVAILNDDDETEEESCGSCKITDDESDKINKKYIAKLEKLFDKVEVKEFSDYQLLTIKDRSPNSSIDWIVWLSAKINIRTVSQNRYNERSTAKYLEGALKIICDFTPLLTKYKDFNKPQQNSLFEDSEEVVLEEEPPTPTDEGGDKSWGKYYNECEKIRKRNIMKQYEFFDVCDFHKSWFSHLDWLVGGKNSLDNKLPKDNKELLRILKENIINITREDREAYGRFDEIWWDNSCQYFEVGADYSDLELILRVETICRLYLVPYTRYQSVGVDNSFNLHSYDKKETDYHFYFDRGEFSSIWGITIKRDYSLFDQDFIDWLREWFDIGYIEAITDEQAFKDGIAKYYERVTEDFDYITAIKKVTTVEEYIKLFNAKDVKKDFLNDAGFSIDLDDGYGGMINLHGGKGDEITFYQRRKAREILDLKIEDDSDNWKVDLLKLNGVNEIHKKAFELHCDREAIELANSQGQGSLF